MTAESPAAPVPVSADQVSPGPVSQDYAPEREVRFAVVLYGGVSLAIYINGVAQELLRMVRGTADLPDDALSGSEKVYRELGQILTLDRKPLGQGETLPDEGALASLPIRTRFVVDIISGSSAGGINGIALAKALALRLPSLDGLRDVWLKEADLQTLLNDDLSQPGIYPPNPDRRTTSLINSERMYGKILETLSKMNPDKAADKGSSKGAAFADEIDLFVTATDLAGMRTRIQLTGGSIDERNHKCVFHFQYTGSANPAENDFTRDYDPMLAFAARCTSSFPVAFEPMCFKRIETQLKRLRPDADLNRLVTEYQKFFPPEIGPHEIRDRLFADGGYLDNRPFSYATDVIQYRSSTRPVDRKLLFVDPFPEAPASQDPSGREIGFLENARLAAMTLPRYEVIRGDIQVVNAMNRQLDRLAALRDRIATDRKRLAYAVEAPPSPEDFDALDLEQMVKTFHYGDKYPPYHHLRVYDVSDALARMVANVCGFTANSDYYYYLRMLVRAWREATFSAYRERGKETENAFLDRYDSDYRLRRLNHLRAAIDARLTGKATEQDRSGPDPVRALTEEDRRDLNGLRQIVEGQIFGLQDTLRKLQSSTQLRTHPELAALKGQLDDHYETVMNQVERLKRYTAAGDIYAKLKESIDAVMTGIAETLRKVFSANSDALLEAFTGAGSTPCRREIYDKIYQTFHWHDALTLAMLEGTQAREHSEIAVFRVSPADGSLVPPGVSCPEKKLAGIKAGAFGGFLHREWRENDIMWGRLDGAERIITALLPDGTDARLRQHYIEKVQQAILAEEFALDVPAKHDRVFGCLARKLRGAEATSASVEDLLKHRDEVLSAVPPFVDVLDRRDFTQFLRSWYSVSAPPRERLMRWTSRSLKILGRMVDDHPGGTLGVVAPRLAGGLRSAGALLTNLLRFATPGAATWDLARYWLMLVALAGLLLVVVGPWVSSGVGYVGVAILVGCLVGWFVQRLFGNLLIRKSVFSDAAFILAAATLIALVVLGGYTAWEMATSFLDRIET